MNRFRLFGLAFAVIFSFVTSALCDPEVDLKEKPSNLVSVNRLREIAKRVNSLDTTWEAELPESWVQGENTLLDLSHLTGTWNPQFVDKSEFSMKKSYGNNNAKEADGGDDDDDDDDDDDESEEEEEKKKESEDKAVQCENNGLPKSFDAREKWSKCKSTISHIYDQGNCGACWVCNAYYCGLLIKIIGIDTVKPHYNAHGYNAIPSITLEFVGPSPFRKNSI